MAVVDAGSNSKALDAAVKVMRGVPGGENAAIMLFSVDEDEGKCCVLSSVTDSLVRDKGFKANEWVQQVSGVINGKGGGKELNAQAVGSNVGKVEEAVELARKFAELKLGAL